MDVYVFTAVLIGAACHAGWNSFLKSKADPLLMVALIALGSSVLSIPIIVVLGFPHIASLPWLAISVVLHTFYLISLITAYRHGDMSQVYPLARGTAPLLTALIGTLVLGEFISAYAWIGVVLLVCGIFLMSARGQVGIARINSAAVRFALLTAVIIAGYSVVDGLGARAGSEPLVYTAWLFLLDGIAVGVLVYIRRGKELTTFLAHKWRPGLFGGGLSLASYGIAIWAMTKAPIALVAALRETSVLFAALISVVFLREKLNAARVVAIVVIVAGLLIMRTT